MLWGAMVATILSVVICIPPAKNVHNQGRGQGQLRHGWTVYIPPRHGQRQNQMHGQMQGEYQQVDDPNK